VIGKIQSGEFVKGSQGVGNAYSYFARATGKEQDKSGKKEVPDYHFPGLTGKTDTKDRIKLSNEALFGSLSGDNGTQETSRFNLESFRNNLGLTPPASEKTEKKEGGDGKSLWEKLEMVSLKTAGQGW
jgi:hypothetical protein